MPINLTRRFRAPPERVFDAWLDRQTAGRWLFATATRPVPQVAIDARPGGSYRFVDRYHGGIVEHRGEYIEIVPGRRLVFTLAGTRRPPVPTRVIVEFAPRERGCEVKLRHEQVPAEHARYVTARWTGMLYGLGVTLTAHRRSKPPESRREPARPSRR